MLAAVLVLTLAGCSSSSPSAQTGNGGTINLTMSLQDNTSSNYDQGAMKIAENVANQHEALLCLHSSVHE